MEIKAVTTLGRHPCSEEGASGLPERICMLVTQCVHFVKTHMAAYSSYVQFPVYMLLFNRFTYLTLEKRPALYYFCLQDWQ